MQARVSILGAGNGGCAMAASLASRGIPCTLFDLPRFDAVLAPIRESGVLRLTGALGDHTVPAPAITTDVRVALESADVLVVAVPAFAQEVFAEACAPFLRADQVAVLAPGSTGGALAFAQVLHRAGSPDGVVVAETLSLPYACRKIDPNHVHVGGVKRNLPVAAFPATGTGRVLAALESVLPGMFVAAANVLETSLNNPNAMAHPVPALLNAGWIETTGGTSDSTRTASAHRSAGRWTPWIATALRSRPPSDSRRWRPSSGIVASTGWSARRHTR